MLRISEIYTQVCEDFIGTSENGDLLHIQYNRYSNLAQLRLADYLSGDISGLVPPTPYTTEKIRDWASPFIKKESFNVTGGKIDKPADYYLYEGLRIINATLQKDCETGEAIDTNEQDGGIELLEGLVFDSRVNTFIKRMQPTIKKPIAKRVGDTFEFYPKDLGTIELSYWRYPVIGKIVSKEDKSRHDIVVDEVKSTNYEYREELRGLLIWFIVQQYSIHTRESALFQVNSAYGKTEREAK